jgi:hypothetical protein
MYQLMWKYAKGKVDMLGVYERPEQAWAAVLRDMRTLMELSNRRPALRDKVKHATVETNRLRAANSAEGIVIVGNAKYWLEELS